MPLLHLKKPRISGKSPATRIARAAQGVPAHVCNYIFIPVWSGWVPLLCSQRVFGVDLFNGSYGMDCEGGSETLTKAMHSGKELQKLLPHWPLLEEFRVAASFYQNASDFRHLQADSILMMMDALHAEDVVPDASSIPHVVLLSLFADYERVCCSNKIKFKVAWKKGWNQSPNQRAKAGT